MIYLIGTNHELQYNAKPKRGEENMVLDGREKFQNFLYNQIVDLKPVVIGEESVEEILDLLQTESTVKTVADKLGVKHIYCDPNYEARNILGIPIGSEHLKQEDKIKYYNIRENYWFKKIEPYIGECIIFVCGAEHIESFQKLLAGKNCESKIISEYWGINIYGG
jgi:hypothetical protein